MTVAQDPRRAMEDAHRRLQHLYEVGQILTRTEGMDETVEAVLALLARALDLRSASVVHATTGPPASWVWPVGDESANRENSRPARGWYAYLCRPSPTDEAVRRPSAHEREIPFVALPLVVRGRPMSGVVWVERAARLEEIELDFLNAVANQLAVGLDRIVAWSHDRERREHAEQRQVEAEASRARYEGLVDSLDQAFVWEADPRLDRVTYVSAQIEAVLGSARGEWTDAPGRLIQAVLPEDRTILLAALGRLSAEGTDQRCEHRCLARDGTIRWLRTGLHLAAAGGPNPTVQAVSVDVTATKEVEAALETAIQARNYIMEVVSHDLRDPLHAMMMSTRILEKHLTADGPKAMLRMTDTVFRSGGQMSRLIGDLSDFAAIQAGRVELDLRLEPPRSLVASAVATLEPVARELHQTLKGEAPGDLPFVLCDRDRVQQVFSNLVGNAANATPDGGTITLSAAGRGSEVVFSVADTGPGIPAEEIALLFERYVRGNSPRYKGSGLGLAIAQGIVIAHGGKIWAESVVGSGATFFFSIPTAADPP